MTSYCLGKKRIKIAKGVSLIEAPLLLLHIPKLGSISRMIFLHSGISPCAGLFSCWLGERGGLLLRNRAILRLSRNETAPHFLTINRKRVPKRRPDVTSRINTQMVRDHPPLIRSRDSGLNAFCLTRYFYALWVRRNSFGVRPSLFLKR